MAKRRRRLSGTVAKAVVAGISVKMIPLFVLVWIIPSNLRTVLHDSRIDPTVSAFLIMSGGNDWCQDAQRSRSGKRCGWRLKTRWPLQRVVCSGSLGMGGWYAIDCGVVIIEKLGTDVMAVNRVNLFSTKFQRAIVTLHVMIGTKYDDVLCKIRAIVRPTQWLYVVGLCVCIAVGQHYRIVTELTFILVK